MLILAKIKAKWTAALFGALLISAFAMGIYANLPAPKQAGQVNIPLYLVAVQQQELIDRGHDIEKDGKFGPKTDYALILELTKENE